MKPLVEIMRFKYGENIFHGIFRTFQMIRTLKKDSDKGSDSIRNQSEHKKSDSFFCAQIQHINSAGASCYLHTKCH